MEWVPVFVSILGSTVGAFFATKQLISQDKKDAIAEERRLSQIEQSIALLSRDLEGFMGSIRLHFRSIRKSTKED